MLFAPVKKELTRQMTFIVTQFTKMGSPGALTHLYNSNLKNFIYFIAEEEAGFSKTKKATRLHTL